MTIGELLAAIAPHEREQAAKLAEALHDSEGHEAPLLVRVFSAVGTWIGAAMVAVIFAAMEIHEVVPLALLLAAGLFGGAVWLSRRPSRSLALTQLIWAMALGAGGLVIGALAELDAEEVTLALTCTLINLGIVLLIWVPSLAVISAVVAVGCATWLAALLELPMYPLWVALPCAAIATAAWVFESRAAARLGRSWAALAYGLPIGVAGPLTLIGIEDSGLVAQGVGATIATLAMLGLIGAVLWQAMREQSEGIEWRAHVLGATAAVAVLAARHVPGLSLALLWLLVAQLRRSPQLQVLASIQLAGFLFFFYYQLDTTLLLKSLWVISTGVVLLLGAFVARPQRRTKHADEPRARSRWLPAIGLVALTSALIVGPVVHKQRVLATGQTVLLELAPVDPRSLMQGDYMQLSYAIADEVAGPNWFGVHEFADIPRHGNLVIRLDALGVGHYVRIDDGSPLADGELRLEYRVREDWGRNLRVGSDAFFFEEGSAALYEDARYGEVVVAEDGEAILVGLRDADRRPLGLRLHAD